MKLMIFTGFLFLLASLFLGGLMQACKRPMPKPEKTDEMKSQHLGYTMYYIATAPYPEKAVNGKFYCDIDYARIDLQRMDLNHIYNIYQCEVMTIKEPVA